MKWPWRKHREDPAAQAALDRARSIEQETEERVRRVNKTMSSIERLADGNAIYGAVLRTLKEAR